MATELDYFEYANDAAAQAAYVSNGTTLTSHYPTQDTDHVKATTYTGGFNPWECTDPTKSLTGSWANGWVNSGAANTNERFHIDLGSAIIVTKIYYENCHDSGDGTTAGVKNFTFWGSNSASSFAEITYATDTGWTQLTIDDSTFDQHSAADAADPKYITVTNTTAYQYYAFKFADTWGYFYGYMGVRRIELQAVPLQDYSESTIKSQGTYSLKGIATITASNGKTLTRTVSPVIDLTGQTQIKFDIYASRTGANIKLGIYDATVPTTTEKTYTVVSANTWETVTWDISAVTDANKDAISKIIVTIVEATAANTFYIDNMYGTIPSMGKIYMES